MKVLRLGAGVAAALTVTAVLAAQKPNLHVKMGLWETTVKMNMGNMPQMPQMSDDQLAKMPPAQRQQIENMMKTMQGAPVTTKSCMTPEKFARSSFLQQRPNQECTQTITTNTARAMDATIVCTGANPMTAQMHIEAVSANEYKGLMKGKATTRGGEMDMTIDMSGKWLGADCGDV